jgi:hypothetical protein
MEERTHHRPDVPPADLPAGTQVPLPFDDEAEAPIPFALTARARRTVAPHVLSALRVVTTPASSRVEPPPVVEDDPSDTRPARARALRRSGRSTADIADELGVDELLVRAWAGHVPVARPASSASSRSSARPAERRSGRQAQEAARAAFERTRQAARDIARSRLAAEPGLAAGLGLLAGVSDISPTAVDVTTADARVAGAVVRWLTEVLGADPSEVRLVLRVGPRAAADLARHRWAQAVGLPPERIRATRAVSSATDDAIEGVLRVVDADLAARAAGWRDALLDDGPDRDAGF